MPTIHTNLPSAVIQTALQLASGIAPDAQKFTASAASTPTPSTCPHCGKDINTPPPLPATAPTAKAGAKHACPSCGASRPSPAGACPTCGRNPALPRAEFNKLSPTAKASAMKAGVKLTD